MKILTRLSFPILCLFLVSCSSGPPLPPYGSLIEKTKFIKSEFLNDDDMNLVYDMREGNYDDDPEAEVIIAAGDGVHIVSMQGVEERFIPYQKDKDSIAFEKSHSYSDSPWIVSIIDYPDKEHPSFIATLPDTRKTILYNWDGSIRWSIPGGYYCVALPGDLDGDGKIEIVVETKDTGINILDIDGNSISKLPQLGYLYSQIIGDFNGDGIELMAVSSFCNRRAINIIEGNGKIEHNWIFPGPFREFSKFKSKGVDRLLFISGDNIHIYSSPGKLINKYFAPYGKCYAHIYGANLKISKDDMVKVFLANARGAHAVYVYSSDGELISHITDRGDAFSVIALENADSPTFLVGSRNKVWKYTKANNENPNKVAQGMPDASLNL